MSGSLTEASKRLPPLADLRQAAALLNIPGLDDGDLNTGAPPHGRQATLLAKIAEWAALAARAARESGDLDFSLVTERYAYLIETIDEHDSGWWQPSDARTGGIEESHDSPETYVRAVMQRFLEHMRAHLDDYADLIKDEVHIRVSVWQVATVTASMSAPRPEDCPPARYGVLLKAARISPRAVEIRTPLQVHAYVYGDGVTA
jgi:hypothetical protein